MKLRFNASVLGITIATFGLTFGCTESSENSEGDAGFEADASSDDTNTSGTTTPSVTPTSGGNTTSATGSGTDTCNEDISVVCEGDNRVQVDPCNPGEREVLEACEGACDQGRCVDCAPRGVICDEGDVYPIDSCDQLGAKVEECANGCSAGACVAEECVPSDDKQCVGNLLYAVNSCGDQTNVEAVCDNGCVDGACMGCVDEGETLCYQGDVYPVDSCGHTGVMLEACVASCSVSSTGDSTTAECSNVVCEATQNVECFQGDMYAIDSCGGITDEVVTDCHNGCDEDGCLPCVPAPDGVICFGGDVYDTIGGCDDPSVRSETVKEECDFGCFNGACTEPDECVPAGVVCVDDNVHSIDSCLELGDLLETCTAGCQGGACLASDGGAETSTEVSGSQSSTSATSGSDSSSSETGGGDSSSSETGGSDSSSSETSSSQSSSDDASDSSQTDSEASTSSGDESGVADAGTSE